MTAVTAAHAHVRMIDPGTVGSGYPTGGEAVVTTTFDEEGGITTMTTVIDTKDVLFALSSPTQEISHETR